MIKFEKGEIILDSQTIAGLVLMISGLITKNIPLSIIGLAFYLTK